ncbi:MAG TPA: TolC family protein [Chryseolinea sp.]|nr:TolC family protein [Chryseolinea sp.]HPH46445.1 TolC family protein [Chryseolinea sp.]HPM30792.1 TolC family protein [Chryseolinea sp.]
MRRQLIGFIFTTLFSTVLHAQERDSIFILPDSVLPLPIENFYFLITEHHPVAKQAALLSEFARQEIRLARGAFDPKLEVQWLTKEFSDTEYYNILNGSLKFPTVFPLDPKVGIERNSGTYLNPERYISNDFNYQQFYAGVSLPLGQGLITDERRTALRQAQLLREMNEAEQIKLINKLLLDAAKDYWQWYFAYYNFRLLNQGVNVASEIFRRVKINYELGEAAPIDTVQAKITLQQRRVEQQEALINFLNTGVQLSTYLWDSLNNPLALAARFAPVLQPEPWAMTPDALQVLVDQARENHPDLRKISVKINQLENERKLASEYLKPKLDVSYVMLNQPFDPSWNTSFDPGEDYKFAVDFAFPIFLRKERSKLAQTKLKIETTTFEQNLTERQIVNQLQSSYNELVNTTNIIAQQREMVTNYEILLRAELLNLENGESDLFKISIQQEKLIQSKSKLVKVLSEYEKQKALLYWAAGLRNLNGNQGQ